MRVLLVLQVGYIFILVSTIASGHVLFAANVEDFRTLARQFVPNEMAEQLVAIVSQASEKYEHGDKNDKENPEDDAEYEVDVTEIDKNDVIKQDDYTEEYEEVEISGKPIAVKKNQEFKLKTEVSDPVPGKPAERSNAQHDTSEETSKLAANSLRVRPEVKVNLDLLVEKVRARLLDDFTKNPEAIQKLIQDYKNKKKAENKIRPRPNHFNRESTDTWYEKKPKFSQKHAAQVKNIEVAGNQQAVTTPDEETEEEAGVSANDNPGYNFKEVNLNAKVKQNDSYEDYIMPKKADDIFSSEEKTKNDKPNKAGKARALLPLSAKKMTTKPAKNAVATPVEYEDSNETRTEPETLKARTENIWLDYKENVKKQRNPNTNPNTKAKSAKGSQKVKLGTMIPTRQTYRLSSPNYYGKLPTVAEKYNFNEPLPEKDREHEDLKHFGNPPANINNKVKV